MVKGIGSDIIEVERVAAVMQRHGDRFLRRLFTHREIEYCQGQGDAARRFAGRFAAKEAIVKALGVGFQLGIRWTDIEVVNDSLGKPEVVLSSQLRELVGASRCLVSISHCREYATATAIWLD